MTSILILIGIIGGGMLAIMGVARAQTDAGVAPLEQRLGIVERDRVSEKTVTDAWRAMVLRKFEQQDAKQDLVLDALRVPLWKRQDDVMTRPDAGR